MKTTFRISALLLAVLMAFSVLAMAGCSADDEGGKNEVPGTGETTQGTTEPNSVGIDESALEFNGTGWINAEEFGMKGDGKTVNDAKFAEYIESYDNKPLYFPAGVYCFEKTLNFPDRMFVYMDPDAELKCVAKEPLEYFITLRGQDAELEENWCGFLEYAIQSGIHGGTINANYKAKCALGLTKGMHSKFENFMITNVLEKGIQTSIAKTTDGCYFFENIYIYNNMSLPGTYGIYDNIADNQFSHIVVVNFNTGFYTVGGRFLQCAAWNVDMTNVASMTFAEITGTQSVWIEPSVDTVRYGFKLYKGASTSISDLVYITNTNFYKSDMQKKYPRTLFWAESPSEAKFMVTGVQIRWEDYLSFSNASLPMSTFMNVRIPDGCDGETQFANFRDDSAYLRVLVVEAEKNKSDFYVTGKTNFNNLVASGLYECSLKAGSGGGNQPPVLEKGMLEVSETNGRILQRFYGETTSVYRFFNGIKWSEWIRSN